VSSSGSNEADASLADRVELAIRSVPGVVDVSLWVASGSVALEVVVDERWARGDVEAEVGAAVERLVGRWPTRMRVVGATVRLDDASGGAGGPAQPGSTAQRRVRLLAACPERVGDRLVSVVSLGLAERSVEVGGGPGGSGAARATLVGLRRLRLAVPYRVELSAPACFDSPAGRRTGSLVVLRQVLSAPKRGSDPGRGRWPERLVGAALGASEEESSARAVLDSLNRVLELGSSGLLVAPGALQGEPAG
jgi:hypothetical protein